MLSNNTYSFHILSLNNLTSSSADISFVVATKYTIFDNPLHTIRTASFSAIIGNLVIKVTIKYVHGFSCYESRLKGLSQEATLVLSNTRELDRVPNTK